MFHLITKDISHALIIPRNSMLFRCSLRINGAKLFNQVRKVSILSSLESNSVLVSANKDVYTNLALEHWLYNNLKFNEDDKQLKGPVRKHPVILIWTDEPCVVIGRHQNPWIESNLGIVNNVDLKLARRHSGGGCVYHDENNINISIIGDRKVFDNRQGNLQFLAKILEEKYGIHCEPTKRNDLIHFGTGSKVSGSAAKLGRFNSYHHFTLLIDTDKESLHSAIRQTQQEFIKSNSSQSIRSKVMNLKEIKSDLDVNNVITELSNAYNNLYPVFQPSRLISEGSTAFTGDDNEFRTLSEYRNQLCSWDWLYGMTPKFKLEKDFRFMEGGREKHVKFLIEVNKGLFESISIEGDLLADANPSERFAYMIGTKFTYRDAMINLTKLLKVDDSNRSEANALFGTETLLTTFMLHLVRESNF